MTMPKAQSREIGTPNTTFKTNRRAQASTAAAGIASAPMGRMKPHPLSRFVDMTTASHKAARADEDNRLNWQPVAGETNIRGKISRIGEGVGSQARMAHWLPTPPEARPTASDVGYWPRNAAYFTY